MSASGAENGALTFSGVTMQHRTGSGISVVGPASLLVKDGSVFDTVGIAGNCPVGSTIVVNRAASVTLDHVQIGHSPNAALCVRNTADQATITLAQTTLNANLRGISSEIGSGSTALLVADGLSLTNNSFGIAWEGLPSTRFDIANAAITGNTIGAQVASSGGTFKLRDSNVSNNSDAWVPVTLTGPTASGTGLNLSLPANVAAKL